MNTYISDRKQLGVVSEMLRLQYSATLKDDLTKQIRIARGYILASKNGAYDHMNSWDCGRQDAFGDQVDRMFSRLEILKGAYQLSKGRSTKLVNAMIKAIGEDQIERVKV